MIHKHGHIFMDEKSVNHFEGALAQIEEKYPGVEKDINKRWETGVPHHPKSRPLMEKIAELDFYLLGDYFCWKMGGDGDNGEQLMYLLDIIFEDEDRRAQRP